MTDHGRAAAQQDLSSAVDDLERNLRRVDKYLEFGVKTLFAIAKKVRSKPGTTIPTWVSERTAAPAEHYPLCHALVAATLQKVWHRRRRFNYVGKEDKDKGDQENKAGKGYEDLIKWLSTPFTKSRRRPGTLRFLRELDSGAFGALNPLTASEVLRALLHTSDEATLSPRGMLALFAVFWALGRHHGEAAAAGAALEPWKPTATVTAKCVFTLTAFSRAAEQRASLFGRMRETRADLRGLKSERREIDRWRFCSAAERLAATIQEFAGIAKFATKLEKAPRKILAAVSKLKPTTPQSKYEEAWKTIDQTVVAALAQWRAKLHGQLSKLKPLVEELLPEVIGLLSPSKHEALTDKYCKQFSSDEAGYWVDQRMAATKAKRACKRIVDRLREAIAPGHGSFDAFLKKTEAAYNVANDVVAQAMRPCIRWCETVVRNQVAHASAGNDTEFDAAELISATAICGLQPSFSRLETRDAIQKSRAGSRSDGSWTRGQPIYLKERVPGAWPATPDIIWMLCTALDNYPDVDDVDDILLRFIDWLERTVNVVVYEGKELHGWSSELYRDELTIDVWATAVTVNALLEIRDILERRALQLCERRFTVIPDLEGLDKVLPVDMGAKHDTRLHHRLFQAVRDTRSASDDAEYSFVFHGPPGSSKTKLAHALAAEMWDRRKNDGRPLLIRVTPADFTRQGSDRLDAEARNIFRLLSMTRRVTVLFDEIDELLRERLTPGEPTFFRLVVPAMLNRLQDLRDIAPRQEIAFILGTNFIDRIDPALIRRGRMDAVIAVSYPDAFSRIAILEKGGVSAALSQAIEKVGGLPYSVINDVAKRAKKGNKIEVRREDLTYDVDQHYADPKRWQSRNPALLSEFLHGIAARRENQELNKDHLETVSKGWITDPAERDTVLQEFRELCKREGRTFTAVSAPTTTP